MGIEQVGYIPDNANGEGLRRSQDTRLHTFAVSEHDLAQDRTLQLRSRLREAAGLDKH
jgi:hypothetical protein